MAENVFILGYFNTDREASKAADELRQMGLDEISIDQISRYPGEGNEGILSSPLNGEFLSLAELTLGHEPAGDSPGILEAADPSASGLGLVQEEIQGRSFLLATTCTPQERDQAAQIIRAHHGLI